MGHGHVGDDQIESVRITIEKLQSLQTAGLDHRDSRILINSGYRGIIFQIAVAAGVVAAI